MKNWILFSALTLLLFSCEKENRECPGAIEKNLDYTHFTGIKAGENFTLTITKGDSYSIKATGCKNDLDDMEVSVTDNTLDIRFDYYKPNRYRIDFIITMPAIQLVNLSGNAEALLTGFQQQQNVIQNALSGNATATISGTTINTQVDISGNASLHLSGSTESLYGNISGNGILNAYLVNSTEVDIDASGNARAFVTPLESLFVTASGKSVVKYKGNPAQKVIETTGKGKVIKE